MLVTKGWRNSGELGAKNEGAANLRSLLLACTLPQVLRQLVRNYWLSGLKVRTPASVLEHTPAGSTRTTPSSSAQNARIPVWLIVNGTARATYPTLTPPAIVPVPVVNL